MYSTLEMVFAIYIAYLGGGAVVLWILRPKAKHGV